MKFILYSPLFLSLFISSVYSFSPEICSLQQEKINQDELNFDALEEEAVKINAFATVENKPLHPLMIWLRIIGSPMVNAFFLVSGKIDFFLIV